MVWVIGWRLQRASLLIGTQGKVPQVAIRRDGPKAI
jgi:hypothetical protein